MVFSDLIAAIATAVIAVVALLTLRGRILRESGRRGELVRYFGVAALVALACAVLNILEVVGGGAVAAAVGNATNVFAPAALWAGVRRLNGRTASGLLSAAAVSLLMLSVTFVIPLDAATLLKTGGIAVFSGLGAWELRRGSIARTAGSLTVSVALWVFAAFNVGRIVLAATAGMTSWAWSSFASSEITSVVSAVVILIVTVGAFRIGRHLDDDPEPGTRGHDRRILVAHGSELLAEHDALDAMTLRLPELHLIRAAHGQDRADATAALLLEGVRSALPEAASALLARDSVGVVLPAGAARADAEAAIRASFGRAVALAGDEDVPDLRISYRSISGEDELARFAQGAVSPSPRRDRWRSARTGTRSAG